jgi:hypothetical protein
MPGLIVPDFMCHAIEGPSGIFGVLPCFWTEDVKLITDMPVKGV